MKRATTWIVATAGLWLAAGALAEDASEVPAVTDVATEPAAESPTLDAFDESSVLSDEELGVHRARENVELAQITINDQDQDGTVTDNVATDNTTGDNLINGEAFGNAAGFVSTVQNTGNNVLIQNSTIINVSVEGAVD